MVAADEKDLQLPFGQSAEEVIQQLHRFGRGDGAVVDVAADQNGVGALLIDDQEDLGEDVAADSSYSRKSRKRRRHRKRQSLIRMQIMWTMTRTMDTIRSLRTMMQIAPPMKMIMNLCKQDRLDAWGSLRVAFT